MPDGEQNRDPRRAHPRAGAALRDWARAAWRRAPFMECAAGGVWATGRSGSIGARVVRRGMLGFDGSVTRRADLEAARRKISRARARVRQRLVSGGARGLGSRAPGEAG